MAEAISIVKTRRKSNLDKVLLSSRFLILVCLAVLTALAYVHIKVEEIKLGYDISANRRQEEKTIKESLLLKAELMRLKSPARIEEIAREIGFQFPTQEDVIYIEERTVVGERK
jgi:Cell division protein FtsL.